MKILIAYASKYGFTQKAAEKLRDGLTTGKHEVTLINLGEEQPSSLDLFDAVVIGGSIYAGFIRPEVRRFCQENLAALIGKRLGLFVCCGLENKAEEQLKMVFPRNPRPGSTRVLCYEVNYGKMSWPDSRCAGERAKETVCLRNSKNS